MKQVIPGGRGVRYGQDSNVSYRESIDDRVGNIPESGEWFVSNMAGIDSSASFSQDRLVLYPCCIKVKRPVLHEARISVDTAVAGSYVKIGLYVYRGRSDGFYLYPKSSVKIDCATVGQKAVDLSQDIESELYSRLFIGADVSDAGVGFLGSSTSNGFVISPMYMEHPASSDLPKYIDINSLTDGPTISVPYISYIARDAAEVT